MRINSVHHATSHTGTTPSSSVDPRCPCRSGLSLRRTVASDVDRCRYLAELDHPGAPRWASTARALILYPGLYGVVAYRLAHRARTAALAAPVRAVLVGAAVLFQRVALAFSGVDLDAGAHIGPGLFINHAAGATIGPVDAGAYLTLSHNVTLGQGTGGGPATRRCPRLGDRIWVGVGAVVSGDVVVGDDAVIGANAVVTRDVAARCTVGGVPARVIAQRGSFGSVLYRGLDQDAARADSLRSAEQVERDA